MSGTVSYHVVRRRRRGMAVCQDVPATIPVIPEADNGVSPPSKVGMGLLSRIRKWVAWVIPRFQTKKALGGLAKTAQRIR